MNSPATAIAWEVWSRNRWATTTVAVAIPILAIVNSSWLGEWFRMVEVLLFFFSMTTLVWTFCCVEPDARGKHGGFPPRSFTLPLSTIRLVAVPMLGGAITLAAVYWLWTRLIFTVWDVVVPAALLRVQLLTVAAMLFALQAIVWSLYRFPLIRIVLILAAMIGIGMLGLAAPGKGFRNMSEPAVLGALGVIIALAFAAAVAGVSRDRRGEWEGWTQRVIDRVLALFPRRRKAFPSAAGAQVWFEWRGKAFFLSAVLGLPMILVMMICPVPTMGHFDPVMTATTYANLPCLTLVLAWCVGMTLAKTDYWNRESQLSSFVTARPLTDGDIVLAKLKAAALVIAAAALLFVALAIPSFNVGYWLNSTDMNWPSWSQFKAQNPQLLLNLSHPLVLLTAFAVTWATMAEGLAIGLRGQKSVVIQSVIRTSLFSRGPHSDFAARQAPRRVAASGRDFALGLRAAHRVESHNDNPLAQPHTVSLLRETTNLPRGSLAAGRRMHRRHCRPRLDPYFNVRPRHRFCRRLPRPRLRPLPRRRQPALQPPSLSFCL